MSEPKECIMLVGLVDVAGFASACGGRSDRETFDVLNSFYCMAGETVRKEGGTVIKYMGDGILVAFPEEKAGEAAIALGNLVKSADSIFLEFSDGCKVRAKTHIGPVVMGPMGTDGHVDVIGNTLNELFRLPWSGD